MKKEKLRRIVPLELIQEESKKAQIKKKPRKRKEVHYAYIQVGVSNVEDRKLRYSDVPKCDGGWVRDLKYRPISFDLVFLRIEGRERVVSGWWTGTAWEGRLWRPDYKVLAWKRNIDWD